ncbi:MAG TPA: hypothetical protein VMU96_10690 [Casimicrobiaceae bacterium]|nr:hypothetical protein [Casimicrobiaceae bacterium]
MAEGAQAELRNLSRWRDEIGITPDHFKAGNDRNANTAVLDFMPLPDDRRT